MNLFDLSGKVAIVTGAKRGLGKAMAIALAEAGADIALIQRGNHSETKQKIEELNKRCEIFECDLEDKEQIKEAIANIEGSFGHIDILVNNAGIQRRSKAEEFSDEDWSDVIKVNLDAVFYLSRETGKRMVKQGHGKIINIASLLTFQGGFTVPAYAAAKGGVGQLTKALANEWAKHGVNVNAIAPGYMATDMTELLMQDETRNRQILERIPSGRWGKPEDLSGAVIFLASEASNYVDGHILVVDGGWMGR